MSTAKLINAAQLADACHIRRADADHWLPHLITAADRYEINTPHRLAAWIAQIAHESGRFRYVREIWGPTDAQKRYEGRADLGNTQPGDGKRYMGRGLIQITGRNNYRGARNALGVDCEANPALLEEPAHAAMSAAWFWYTRRLNAWADIPDFETITRRINGGLNGYSERLTLWNSARRALGIQR